MIHSLISGEILKMLPDELRQYIEAAKEEAKYKKIKDGLRPTILGLLKGGKYEEAYWSQVKNFEFIPDKLYEFVASKVPPNVLETVTIRTIDESKLDDLYADKYFELDDIPEECYKSGKTQDRINITRPKKV